MIPKNDPLIVMKMSHKQCLESKVSGMTL